MINITDLKELNKELENAIINFEQYHSDMEQNRLFYKNSAFYAPKAGQSRAKNDLKTNLLRVFADKNIHYTSQFPVIKVPTTGSSPEQRQAASIREKILYGVHEKSGTAALQKKWARDVTLRSVAIAETVFDLDKRCAYVRRYDPRYVFWQLSNDNDRHVIAFWAVFPITKDECLKKYGFTPTSNLMATSTFADQYLSSIDGKDWFMQAIRWDENTRVSWVGDHIIEEPHNHMLGTIPVDICMPFDDEELNSLGSFYLEPLVPLQAELNHVIRQRANIVQRMANPLVWGRGIVARQFDDVKNNLSKSGGGFVGLKAQGELGLLQVNDVKLLNEHADDLVNHMMKLSGFSSAAFGESVGANTSGDALGMYFMPTMKLIDHQNISWTAFYKGINSKILRYYDKFAKYGEKFELSGFSPSGSLLPSTDEKDQPNTLEYQQAGGFDISFDKSIIGGNYNSVVTFSSVAPKNEIEEKRFWLDAANLKIISRTTAFENIGVLSPEDELAMLTQEQQEPALNPDGTQKILQSATQLAQAQLPAQLPQAQPAPIAPPQGVANGA